MKRACCPVPAFHIFGEVGGTLNINAPGYFTVFPAMLPDTLESMRAVQEEKCTAIMGPPIIFLDLLYHPRRKEFDMTSLLYGIIGAAPVNPKLMEQIEREVPIKALGQAFGQTENTGALTQSITAGDNKQLRYTSVGKAMPRVELKIVDKTGHILPIGEEGEVWGRGFTIMKGAVIDIFLEIQTRTYVYLGYYGDEAKTRETITPSGWLKTGDIGVMDKNGYIFYRTRQKELIIVGGINVYPVEIENFLLEHPKILEAQVFSAPDPRYGEVVCAWIKPKANTKIDDTEEIRRFLSEKIAFFKVPKHVKMIESFAPYMTPTGKVQKFKLTEVMAKELRNETS